MDEPIRRRAFSVATFARHAGRVLLVRHRRLGAWLPVGGEIEPGETPLEAAARELREETGLAGEFPTALGVDGTPPGLLGYEEHAAGSKGLHMNFAFVADVATERVVSNGEFDAHRWVSSPEETEAPRNVRELAAMALRGDAAALAGIARRWLAAFNARDLEALLALYAEDAIHTSPKLRARSPETQGKIVGKPALRAWFADAFGRLPGLHYEERCVSVAAGRVVLEYARRCPGEPEMAVAESFAIRGGLVAESHVYHG